MASSRRLPTPHLIERLLRRPESFDLVQAVRILERRQRMAAHSTDETHWQRSAVFGLREDVNLDAVRFTSSVTVRYPTSSISRAVPGGEENKPTRLTIDLFGLIGPLGVLPYGYTEKAIESLHARNLGYTAFLDIFQNRAVTLFYRAACKYRIAVARERARPETPDTFTTVLRSLAGIGTPATSNRLSVPDDTILHNAGLFVSRARTMPGLEGLLMSELNRKVSVEPFLGGWLPIAEDEQSRLPGPGLPDGTHCALGSSAMVGARAWVAQDAFRLVVGPVDAAGLKALLPGGLECTRVVDLVRLYCGLEFDFDLNVIVKAESVPAARLARGDDDPEAARLGQTAWMLSSPSPVNRHDAVIPIGRLG